MPLGPSPYSKDYSPTVVLLIKLNAVKDKRRCPYLTVNSTSLSKASIKRSGVAPPDWQLSLFIKIF